MLYSPFNELIIRTPLLPFNEIDHLSVESIKMLCKKPLISEAIYMASPELHKEMLKWLNEKQSKVNDKLIFSLLKYLLRMGNRCTPFGLFCGIAKGTVSEVNHIEVDNHENHRRSSRLDMNFLCALAQNLENTPSVRNDLKFFPNTSLYQIGDQLRYIEYRYEHTIRKHYMMSIDFSEYVQVILEKAREGSTINALATTIVEPEITLEDAIGFIHELIDNQILISSISPSLTGENYFDIIKKNVPSFSHAFTAIEDVLKEINHSEIGTGIDHYESLKKTLIPFQIGYDEKFLLQTDLAIGLKKNTVSRTVLNAINDALTFLNKLTDFEQEKDFTRFRNAFYERYEDEEVPLALALDVESGIGYANGNSDFFDISPLVDDIDFSSKKKSNTAQTKDIKWTRRDQLLIKKLNSGNHKNTGNVLELTDDDVRGFEENWNNIPNTFSLFVNILDANESTPKLRISNIGGESATTLTGRFCHLEKEIADFVQKIADKERVSDQQIHAEILHLPEKRVGNILHRPHLRHYEIPYLAKSTLPSNRQIPINDLLVSVKDDRIILRSKSQNKEVLPKMATAHNYGAHSLPIYHFLCALQLQDLRGSLSFDWGNLYSLYDVFPRVLYKGIILSSAIWVVRENAIKDLMKNHDILRWRNLHGIPSKVLLVEGDNELFIDTTHELSVKMFISLIKNKSLIILSEYLFDHKNSLVKRGQEAFTNEIIISYFKNKAHA